MSETYSDELLSAYVDGELSAEAGAAIERWIEHSPEARQKVEDFRRLSRLFSDLSRTEVPREFSTEVLHLAERRMLLPEAAAIHGRKRFRGWALALAAPTAAAAVLLLVFKISNRDNGAPDRPMNVAERTNREPSPLRGSDAAQPGHNEASGALVTSDDSRSGDQDRPIAGEAGRALRLLNGRAPSGSALGGAGGASSATELDVAKSKLAAAAPGGPQSQAVEADSQLQAIGQAMQEIRDAGTADKMLVVVRVYVVDRAEGMVLLQEDFAANNIRIDSREATRRKGVDGEKQIGEANHEGLYVEAQPDEFVAGFKTFLARAHPGDRVSVEQSIELAALDAESQKQFSPGDFKQPVVESRGDGEPVKESKDAVEGAKPAASRTTSAADGAVRGSRHDVADAGQAKKPAPAATPRKKSPAVSNPGSNQKSERGMGTVERSASAPPPSDKEDFGAKEGETKPEANQMANRARQMVIPVMPPAIQNRVRSSGGTISQADKDTASLQKQQGVISQSEGKTRDEKSLARANDKLGEPSPALVRMLIVIEREPQQPAAPAAKKDPCDGAS